jgi:hypothetical protein
MAHLWGYNEAKRTFNEIDKEMKDIKVLTLTLSTTTTTTTNNIFTH